MCAMQSERCAEMAPAALGPQQRPGVADADRDAGDCAHAATLYSLVIPIYKNEATLPRLLETLEEMNGRLGGRLQVVFVVDGSPDRSLAVLRQGLPACGFAAELVSLSRNFGSFAAIRMGLSAARPVFRGHGGRSSGAPGIRTRILPRLERPSRSTSRWGSEPIATIRP